MNRNMCSVIMSLVILMTSPGIATAVTPDQQKESSFHLQLDDSDPHFLRVSGWEFQVRSAEMAPVVTGDFSLGNLEDGRHWLVIQLTGSNTGSDRKSIHSDDIQLNFRGELIKQTGNESQLAADALGIMSIGGTFNTNIDAGETFDFVQVYKIAPEANGLRLDFDFNGIWSVGIDDLIALSSSDTEKSTEFAVQTNKLSAELLSAVTGRSFSGQFHLGTQPDLSAWTVVLLNVTVHSGEEVRVSDFVTIETDSVEYASESIFFADTDATRDVADEIGVQSGTNAFNNESTDTAVVLVFSTPIAMGSSILAIEDQGTWFFDLGSVLDLSDGSSDVIDPSSPMDLSALGDQEPFVPTPEPTATMAPTPTPAPAIFGSLDNPATIGDTIHLEGFEVTLEEVAKADSIGGILTSRGGSTFIIIEIRVTRVGDGSADVGTGDFTLWNPVTNQNYSNSGTTFTNQPFRSADLAPGEYVYGQIAFEVPENFEYMTVRFRPAIWGDEGYWGFRS